MEEKTIRARLEADISAYTKGLDEAKKKLDELNKSHDGAARSAENLGRKADQAEQSTRRHGDTAADVSRRVNDLRQALNGSTDAVIDLAAAAFRSGGVMGALGTTVAALGVAAAQGYFETQKLNREIILSGSIAGQTTGQMLDLARSVGAMTGSQSQAIEVLTRLAGESAMSAEALKRITTTAIELEQVGGAAVEKTVDAFVKLAEDPVDASIRLNEQYNYLTQAVFDQIRALEEQGQKDAAAEMAQNALADALQVRTKRAAEDVGTLERLWDELRKTALQAWNAMADAGRMKTIDEQVREAEAALRGMETQSPEYEWWGSKKKLEDQRKLVEQLRAQRDAEHEAARAAAERQQVEAAGIQATGELIRLRERHASTEEKLSAALKDYRAKLDAIAKANPDSPLLDPKKVAADEKAIRESFERVTRLASGLRVATADAQARNAAALDTLIEKIDAEAVAEAARAVAEYNAAWAEYLNGLDGQRRGLEEQVELFGLTEAQIAAVTLRRAEERLEMARAGGVTPDYLAALEREVALRREIAGAAGTLEAKRANAEAAQAATREWERTAQEIEGAIYEAIVSGGEDAGEVLERTFKALVLRPIIQPVAQAAAGVVTGALGVGQAGSSGGGLGGFGLPPGVGGNLLGSGALWAGGALGAGTTLGGFMTGFGTALTSGAGTLGTMSAGASLMGTAGGGAAGAGMIAGAALPWIGGGLALASVLGAFDKKPSDKTSWGSVNALTGAVTVDSMTGKKDPGQSQRDATAQVLSLLGAFAGDVGLSGLGVSIGGRDGVRMSLSGGFRSPTGGLNKFGEVTYGGSGDVEGALRRMLDDIVDEGTLPQATIDAWRQMRTDAAGVARDAQEQMDVLDLLTKGINEAEIERANTMQQAGETLAAAYARMVAVEESIRAAISAAFDTPEEQLTAAFDAIGVAIPQTVAAYEALVKAQDLTTEAGRNQAVALLSAKGVWDAVQREQEAAAEAARRAAEEARRAWEALRDDLSAFRVELTAGALAGLSPEAAYAAAEQSWMETSRLAGLGNQDALAQLAEAGRALLAASEAYNARTGAYFSDRDRVLSAVDAGVALTGRKIEGFANGGFFGGGLRIVGERGPELEATGAARYWSAQETRTAMGGGAEAVRELQAVVRVLSTGLSSIDRRLANLERSSEEQARAARLAADRRPGEWRAA